MKTSIPECDVTHDPIFGFTGTILNTLLLSQEQSQIRYSMW